MIRFIHGAKCGSPTEAIPHSDSANFIRKNLSGIANLSALPDNLAIVNFKKKLINELNSHSFFALNLNNREIDMIIDYCLPHSESINIPRLAALLKLRLHLCDDSHNEENYKSEDTVDAEYPATRMAVINSTDWNTLLSEACYKEVDKTIHHFRLCLTNVIHCKSVKIAIRMLPDYLTHCVSWIVTLAGTAGLVNKFINIVSNDATIREKFLSVIIAALPLFMSVSSLSDETVREITEPVISLLPEEFLQSFNQLIKSENEVTPWLIIMLSALIYSINAHIAPAPNPKSIMGRIFSQMPALMPFMFDIIRAAIQPQSVISTSLIMISEGDSSLYHCLHTQDNFQTSCAAIIREKDVTASINEKKFETTAAASHRYDCLTNRIKSSVGKDGLVSSNDFIKHPEQYKLRYLFRKIIQRLPSGQRNKGIHLEVYEGHASVYRWTDQIFSHYYLYVGNEVIDELKRLIFAAPASVQAEVKVNSSFPIDGLCLREICEQQMEGNKNSAASTSLLMPLLPGAAITSILIDRQGIPYFLPGAIASVIVLGWLYFRNTLKSSDSQPYTEFRDVVRGSHQSEDAHRTLKLFDEMCAELRRQVILQNGKSNELIREVVNRLRLLMLSIIRTEHPDSQNFNPPDTDQVNYQLHGSIHVKFDTDVVLNEIAELVLEASSLNLVLDTSATYSPKNPSDLLKLKHLYHRRKKLISSIYNRVEELARVMSLEGNFITGEITDYNVSENNDSMWQSKSQSVQDSLSSAELTMTSDVSKIIPSKEDSIKPLTDYDINHLQDSLHALEFSVLQSVNNFLTAQANNNVSILNELIQATDNLIIELNDRDGNHFTQASMMTIYPLVNIESSNKPVSGKVTRQLARNNLHLRSKRSTDQIHQHTVENLSLYSRHDKSDLISSGLSIVQVGDWLPTARLHGNIDFPPGHYIKLSYKVYLSDKFFIKRINIKIPLEKRASGLWHKEAARQITEKGEGNLVAGEVTEASYALIFKRTSINAPVISSYKNIIYAINRVNDVYWEVVLSDEIKSLYEPEDILCVMHIQQITTQLTALEDTKKRIIRNISLIISGEENAEKLHKDLAKTQSSISNLIQQLVVENDILKKRIGMRKFPLEGQRNASEIDFSLIGALTNINRVYSDASARSDLYIPCGYNAKVLFNECSTSMPSGSYITLVIFGEFKTSNYKLSIAIPEQKKSNFIWQHYVACKINEFGHYYSSGGKAYIKAGKGVMIASDKSGYGLPDYTSYRNVIYAHNDSGIISIRWMVDNTPVLIAPESSGRSDKKGFHSDFSALFRQLSKATSSHPLKYHIDSRGVMYDRYGEIKANLSPFTPWMAINLNGRENKYLAAINSFWHLFQKDINLYKDLLSPHKVAELFTKRIKVFTGDDAISSLSSPENFLNKIYREKKGTVVDKDFFENIMGRDIFYNFVDTEIAKSKPGELFVTSRILSRASGQLAIKLYDYITQGLPEDSIRASMQTSASDNEIIVINRSIGNAVFPHDIDESLVQSLKKQLESGALRQKYEQSLIKAFARCEYLAAIALILDVAVSAKLQEVASGNYNAMQINSERGTSAHKPLTAEQRTFLMERARFAMQSGRGLLTLKHEDVPGSGMILLEGTGNDKLVLSLNSNTYYLITFTSEGYVADEVLTILSPFFPAGALSKTFSVPFLHPQGVVPATFRERFNFESVNPLHSLLEGYKQSLLVMARSTFPTWLQNKEQQASVFLRDVVTPVITAFGMVLMITSGELALLPEDIMTLEFSEGVSVDIVKEGVRITFKTTNNAMLTSPVAEYFLAAEGNADRPLAAKRAWDNFVRGLMVNLILMSPEFSPELTPNLRNIKAEEEYLKFTAESSAIYPTGIISSLKDVCKLLNQNIETLEVISLSIKDLDRLPIGSRLLLTDSDHVVTNVLVKDRTGVFWLNKADENERFDIPGGNGQLEMKGKLYDIWTEDITAVRQAFTGGGEILILEDSEGAILKTKEEASESDKALSDCLPSSIPLPVRNRRKRSPECDILSQTFIVAPPGRVKMRVEPLKKSEIVAINRRLTRGDYDNTSVKRNFLMGDISENAKKEVQENLLFINCQKSFDPEKIGALYHGNRILKDDVNQLKENILIQTHQMTFFSTAKYVSFHFSRTGPDSLHVIYKVTSPSLKAIKRLEKEGSLYADLIAKLREQPLNSKLQKEIRNAIEGIAPPGEVFRIVRLKKDKYLGHEYLKVYLEYIGSEEKIIPLSMAGIENFSSQSINTG